MPSRRPDERYRTAFYYDCRTARERNLILRRGFRVDESGNAPQFTREVTGEVWFPLKLLGREVRGLTSTDWESYRLNILDRAFEYYELPWGMLENARLHRVSRQRVRQSRQRNGWPWLPMP